MELETIPRSTGVVSVNTNVLTHSNNVLTYYMKQISIREFQLHAERYLKDLPITLTRYGTPIASVVPFKSFKVSDELIDEKDLSPKPMTPTPPIKPKVYDVIAEPTQPPRIIWFGGHKWEVDEFGNEKLIK